MSEYTPDLGEELPEVKFRQLMEEFMATSDYDEHHVIAGKMNKLRAENPDTQILVTPEVKVFKKAARFFSKWHAARDPDCTCLKR